MRSCKVLTDKGESKELVLVNSGEAVLIFDLTIALAKGTSGLIKMLNLPDILANLSLSSSDGKVQTRRS